MVHTILGNYKYGDVSELDGRFLKIKPMHDAEAIIIGWNKRNVCGVEVDEFGSWQVEHPTMGKFDLGGQISDSMRAEFRRDISKYVGQQAVFKYQKHGMKPDGGPRSPIFKGIRYD